MVQWKGPLPVSRGVLEETEATDRTADVTELSGVIQVSDSGEKVEKVKLKLK